MRDGKVKATMGEATKIDVACARQPGKIGTFKSVMISNYVYTFGN